MYNIELGGFHYVPVAHVGKEILGALLASVIVTGTCKGLCSTVWEIGQLHGEVAFMSHIAVPGVIPITGLTVRERSHSFVAERS